MRVKFWLLSATPNVSNLSKFSDRKEGYSNALSPSQYSSNNLTLFLSQATPTHSVGQWLQTSLIRVIRHTCNISLRKKDSIGLRRELGLLVIFIIREIWILTITQRGGGWRERTVENLITNNKTKTVCPLLYNYCAFRDEIFLPHGRDLLPQCLNTQPPSPITLWPHPHPSTLAGHYQCYSPLKTLISSKQLWPCPIFPILSPSGALTPVRVQSVRSEPLMH